ncbi:MAG TPA: TetR/AcrR family transcriptional regulator [Bdellovibrionota bacterium]|jgi:AcrR family transcriptional regulator|nr:TetR/AcrR family transcriptional regulator [Bdellovibrionota bacterium]
MPQKKAEAVARKVTIEEALVQVVKLFLVHPPYKLTYSKISRVTKIPRSTLYYYFGSKVESLLTEAVRHSLKLFLHLDSLDDALKKNRSWDEFQENRLLQAMQQVQGSPWAPRVYMLFRDDPGAIGKAAREVETTYLKQMAKAWKYYHPREPMNEDLEIVANALKMGLLWGLSVQLSGLAGKKPLAHPEAISRQLTSLIKLVLRSPS